MTTLSYESLSGMLEYTAVRVLEHIEELNILDTKIGDGDHGTTMLKVMTCVQKTLKDDTSQSCKKVLEDIGWNVMSQDGGSAGMLLGCFFTGMASGVTGEQPLTIEFARILREGASNLIRNSGAKLGDKTMLDAMLPAIATFEEAALGGTEHLEAFRLAASAAKLGVEATKDMIPTRGRAKNLKEKALGVCDPGATSMALIFNAFYEYWLNGGK